MFSQLSIYSVRLFVSSADAPSKTDPAISDPLTRQRICDDITGSGFFHLFKLSPVNLKEIADNRFSSKYIDIFLELFTSSVNSPDLYEYSNPYKQRLCSNSISALYNFNEYLFLCPLEYLLDYENADEDLPEGDKPIIPFFVTKEYNVSPIEGTYKPGRFVFGDLLPDNLASYFQTILAEEPVNAYINPGFNVELFYLERRKYVQPGKLSE